MKIEITNEKAIHVEYGSSIDENFCDVATCGDGFMVAIFETGYHTSFYLTLEQFTAMSAGVEMLLASENTRAIKETAPFTGLRVLKSKNPTKKH